MCRRPPSAREPGGRCVKGRWSVCCPSCSRAGPCTCRLCRAAVPWGEMPQPCGLGQGVRTLSLHVSAKKPGVEANLSHASGARFATGMRGSHQLSLGSKWHLSSGTLGGTDGPISSHLSEQGPGAPSGCWDSSSGRPWRRPHLGVVGAHSRPHPSPGNRRIRGLGGWALTRP